MSKESDKAAQPVATVTLTLSLGPALSTEELIAFSSAAVARGESVAARVARLIREDIAAPTAA